MMVGHDLHNEAMHCDVLTKSAIQTCAENAVQASVANATQLYGCGQCDIARTSVASFSWLAALVALLFFVLRFVVFGRPLFPKSAIEKQQTIPMACGLE